MTIATPNWKVKVKLRENPKPILRSLPIAKQCQYLGERLTADEIKAKRLAGCRSCNNQINVFHCKLAGQKKFNDGPYTRGAECMSCDDWKGQVNGDTQNTPIDNLYGTTQPIENTRQYNDDSKHLLFHIWPRKTHAGTWQRNLDQLKLRWPLFTGKRIIAVVTSNDSHPFEAVQEYMHGYECEWVHAENNPALREVATFNALFGAVENLPGYTFYAQAKGVTKPVNPGVSIHAWTTTMYEILLDYWPLVEQALKTHCTTGIFKKSLDGAFSGSRSTWHYSGSFCWFKNAELWRRNWRAIERVWFGIESYPSMIFDSKEAACLFYESTKQFDLYRLHNWQRVEAELKQWRLDNQQHRTGIIK